MTVRNDSRRGNCKTLRALIDDGLARGLAFDGAELAPAFAELAKIYRVTDATEPFLMPPRPLSDVSK